MNRPLLDPLVALGRRFVLPLMETPARPAKESKVSTRIGFRLGSSTLLALPGTLAEIMDPPPVYRLPNTPDWCLGMINLRGNLLPVFNAHALLGEPATRQPRLLILGSGTEAAGLMVDGLPFSVQLPAQGATTGRPPLHDLLEPHLGEFWRHESELLISFDHRSFLRQLARMMEN